MGRAESKFFLNLLATAALVSACAESRQTDTLPSDSAVARSGIMGAQLADLKQDPLARAVVFLERYDGGGDPLECTATLVGDQLLITAAHCVFGAEKKKLTPFPIQTHALSDREYFAFLDYVDAHAPMFHATAKGDPSLRFDVVEVAVHPDYKGSKPSGAESDIALIRLGSPVTSGATKTKLDFSTKPEIGNSVVSYGYGKNKRTLYEGHVELTGDQSLRHKEFAVIPAPKLFAEEKIDVSDSFLFGTRAGDAAGLICPGDSGGPLFVVKNDEYLVAGVLSRGDGGCQQYGVATSVSPYQTWIQKQATAWKLKLY